MGLQGDAPGAICYRAFPCRTIAPAACLLEISNSAASWALVRQQPVLRPDCGYSPRIKQFPPPRFGILYMIPIIRL